MAITPPGAGELARLRDLVGSPPPTPLAPPEATPATPLYDPSADVPVTMPVTPGTEPRIKPSLRQEMLPQDLPVEELQQPVDPEEEERAMWRHLETPEELISAVMQKAREADISAETLIKEGRVWSDVFPEEEMQDVENEAASLRALKAGLLSDDDSVAAPDEKDIIAATEGAPAATFSQPETLPETREGAEALRVAATRQGLFERGYPVQPVPERLASDSREARRVEYERQLEEHLAAPKPSDLGGLLRGKAYEQEYNERERRLVGVLGPYQGAQIDSVDLGSGFDQQEARRQDFAERERAVRRGDPEVAGQLASLEADKAYFEQQDQPRVVLPPGSTSREIYAAVTDSQDAERDQLLDDHRQAKIAQGREYTEEELAANRQSLAALNARRDAEFFHAKSWHEQRDRMALEQRPVEGLPEPTELRKETTRLLSRDLPVLPEGKQKEFNEMMREIEASSGDVNVVREIAQKYPTLAKGTPFTVSEQATIEVALTELPFALRNFELLRSGAVPNGDVIRARQFGFAPKESIRAYFGTGPDGNATIDYKVDPELAKVYMAPVGPETEQQANSRVEKIFKAFTRKTFLEKHPSFIISNDHIIKSLADGPSLLDSERASLAKFSKSVLRQQEDGSPLGRVSLADDKVKTIETSELDTNAVREELLNLGPGPEDPSIDAPSELRKTAERYGYTEEAIFKEAITLLKNDFTITTAVKDLKLDKRLVAGGFKAISNAEDLKALMETDRPLELALRNRANLVEASGGFDNSFKKLKPAIAEILNQANVAKAASTAELIAESFYAAREVGDEPIQDYATSFENLEDSLFRGRQLWKPEHVVYDPTGIDDPSFLDSYESFKDNGGKVLMGEEAREFAFFNSQSSVDLAMDRQKALFDVQQAPKPVVVEILADEMLGHERLFPKNLAQHQIADTAMFKVPYVMDFEVGLPMVKAIYDITNETIKNPQTEQGLLKRELIDTLQYAYARLQPTSYGSDQLHAYIKWVEKREDRTLTPEQAMKRWEANRFKWEAKYKQIIMEGFLPQEARTGFRAKIQTSQVAQQSNLVEFLRYSELVPLEMFMMADPSERWVNFKKQRRIPLDRKALEFLKASTKGYIEGGRSKRLIGYNAYEMLGRYDPNLGTTLVANLPVSVDMARRGSTAVTPTPGLIDLTVAQQAGEVISRIGATAQAYGHDETPHYRARNFQAVVNATTRFVEADLLYDDFIDLIENKSTSGVLDILKVHLPHSVNNMVRGTYALVKEGLELTAQIATAPIFALSYLNSLSAGEWAPNGEARAKYIDTIERPDGSFHWQIKTDEQGKPLIDIKTATRLMMTENSLNSAIKDLSQEQLEEAHRKLFVTTPAALKEVALFYVDTFSDWDKFKGYVKQDPFGAFLDVAGGWSLLGKVKVPGAATYQRVRRIDQLQARARQKLRTRPVGTRPQDILSPDEIALFEPKMLEALELPTLDVGGQAVPIAKIVETKDTGVPTLAKAWQRDGDALTPFGHTNSELRSLDSPAEWVSIRSIPHRFVSFVEQLRADGSTVRRAMGLTDDDLSTRYTSSLVVLANTLKFLDHNVPIMGPIVNRSAQIAVNNAASGSRFGMVASYFMNRDSYAGTDLRVKLTEGEKDVHLTTIKTHTQMTKAMEAVGRRLLDGSRLPNIRTILRHTTEEAAEEAFGAHGTALITLKSSNKKLRVSRNDVEKYITENYEEFSSVLDDLWQGKSVDADAYTVDVGDGNYVNLEDLGLVDKKGNASKKLLKLKEEQTELGEKVLRLVYQEMSRSDTRLSDSPAARRTRLYGITKRINGKRATVHVLEEDFIQAMESSNMMDWAIDVINEIGSKGHLDDMMDGGANPVMLYLRTAEVEVSAGEGAGVVSRVSGPGGELPRLEDTKIVDDASIVVRDVYADVEFGQIKDKRKAPVSIQSKEGRSTILIDEKRVLGEWTPDNEKIINGNKFHGPTGEVRFGSPGEYLDFVVDVARAKVAVKKKKRQSAVSHRADYTEVALERFRDRRKGLPDESRRPGRVTGDLGETLRYETVTGETKTAVRGGQVVGFDLHDLGFVRRNGKRWVLSEAGEYVFNTSLDALRVRGPGPVTAGGLSDLTQKILQLVSDGKRGLFAVSNKEMDKALKYLESEIAPPKVGTGGDVRGPFTVMDSDGLAFVDVARAAGLRPTIAVTSSKLLAGIKSLFDEDLIIKTTEDFVGKGLKPVVRKDRFIHAIYRADGSPLMDADLNAALESFDAGDAASTLKAIEDMGLAPDKQVVAKKKDVMLYAYDFRDSAIGRIVGNAGQDVKHLRRVIKALSDEMGQSRDQSVLAGKSPGKYVQTPDRKLTREMEATLRITEEANLERLRNNPLGAVQGSMMALTYEQRLAWVSWLKNGELPEILSSRPDILKAWEKVGLVDIAADGAPQMSPLGVLSSIVAVDHANSFYRTMFTRAIMKDAQLFSGPSGKLFFNPRNYLPQKLAYLAETLQGTLADVQAGLALDWAEHINIMGLEKSTAGTRNMLTHWTRVYQGTFDKYLRGASVADYLDKSISKKSVLRDRSYKELMDAQARRKGVMAELNPYEAALFARVELRHNMHRARAFKQLLADGRIKAGAVNVSGDYIAPGMSAEWARLNLEDMGVMKTPTDMGTIPGELPGELADDIKAAADDVYEKTPLKKVSEEDKRSLRRMRARFKAVEEHQAKNSQKLESTDLHYIFGDLAKSADKMFIRRTDAAIMGLEDRFQHAWARQVLKENAELGVPSTVWDKVAAGAVLGLESVYDVANAVHNHPLTKVFKIRKLMLSALGPASRNIQANTMLTFSFTPEAIMSKHWWSGLSEYWTFYRNGKRPPGAKGAFMDEVSSLGLVQSGLLSEIGFKDYTRLNVGIDKWLSSVKNRMDDYVDDLVEGEKAANAAMFAAQDLAISTRSMYTSGRLDGGDLMKAAGAGASDARLTGTSKQGIVKRMLNTKVGRATREAREALAPLPLESISPDNRFLRAGKNVFNHTDEAFKYAYLKYLYEVKGLRGLKLKETLFKHWPDYGEVADWERMYSLKNSFGVYETKMYQIMTRFMLEHPERARALGLANEMVMATMLSDPETYEEWKELPGYRRMSTSRYPFGWLDEGGFNVMSADRFEVNAFNNPVFQLFLALTGHGSLWGADGQPDGGHARGWFNNLINTVTEISYGSIQVNPLEFGLNLWDAKTDYGQMNDIQSRYGRDPMDWARSLKSAAMQSGGPRWNALAAAWFDEPYPTGADKPTQGVLSAVAGAMIGSRVIERDPFLQDSVRKRTFGESAALLRSLQSQVKRLDMVEARLGKNVIPSQKMRYERAAVLKRIDQVIVTMESQAEREGSTPQMWRALKLAKQLRVRALREGAEPALKYQGPEGQRLLKTEAAALNVRNQEKENKETFKKRQKVDELNRLRKLLK